MKREKNYTKYAVKSTTDLFLAGELVNTLYSDFQGSAVDQQYYFAESLLAEYVREGKPEKVLELMMQLNDARIPMGQPGESDLRSMKNIFITSAGIIRHVAIESGLSPELANEISDAYDRNVEKYTDIDSIRLYICQMIIDFASRIQRLKGTNSTNPLVIKTVNDVLTHVFEKTSPKDIAYRIGYSEEHLCRQFKKETGLTVQQFIMEQKMIEAKIMLRHTDYTLLEIATNLGFQSQNYFQKVFLKYVGTTPMRYRKNSCIV